MYRSCIFCSAEFGANDVLETFPVGRRIAFDAWRGRLWTVCPLCARWNLAPIEERWEAVEQAEKLFRDARMRVQSENVGLARLPDGTTLVRVGAAVPGELAAWRYGTQLLRRRRRYLVVGGVGTAAALGVFGGVTALGVSFLPVWIASSALQKRWNQRVLYRVDPADDPDGAGAVIRRWHLRGMNLSLSSSTGEIAVHVRDAHRREPKGSGEVDRKSKDVLVVSGDAARTVLARAMVHVNRSGATRATLDQANRILASAGSAEHVLRDAAAGGAALGTRAGIRPEILNGPGALAFEMALNEATEREALEGELAALERAWREAEEIAAIADALPGEALVNRLLARLTR